MGPSPSVQLGLTNALLITVWQLAIMIMERYRQVRVLYFHFLDEPLSTHIQGSLVMKTMVPSMPLSVALASGQITHLHGRMMMA